MTADGYVQKYHSISVPEYKLQNGQMYASALVNTPVDEYLNFKYENRFGLPHSERKKLRTAIHDILKEHAPMDGKPVYALGKGFKIENSIAPCAYVDFDMLESAFAGKASPETIFACIQAMSYWRGWRMTVEGTPPPSLASLVDMFLGMDCNGFVGNYLKAKYASNGFKLTPSTPEQDYFYNRKTIRDSPAEIKADDVILFVKIAKKGKNETEEDYQKRVVEATPDWSKSKKALEDDLYNKRGHIGHIIVVSSVSAVGSDRVDVMLSESATSAVPNGGPQTRAFTLVRQGTYRWDISTRKGTVHSILQAKHTTA
jgi:hypothetical protein